MSVDAAPVRLGFVGVGRMGQMAHLRNYALLPDCEVVAIAEPRHHLAQAVATRYRVPALYDSAAAMLDEERLDALVVVQPFDRHERIVAPLYARGLPILTEKPLAISTAVGRRMLAQLESTGSWHMVAYHKRCDPAVTRAKQLIADEGVRERWGAMTYLRMTMPPGEWIAGGFDDQILTAEMPPAEAADDTPVPEYTAFVNYYVHQVNLLRYLLGEDYVVDYADSTGTLLVGHGLGTHVPVVLEMAPWSTDVDWQETVLVAFERGWLRIDLPAPMVERTPGRLTTYGRFTETGDIARVEHSLPPVHAMKAQAAAFIAAVRGTGRVPCDARDALADLVVAEQYFERKGG